MKEDSLENELLGFKQQQDGPYSEDNVHDEEIALRRSDGQKTETGKEELLLSVLKILRWAFLGFINSPTAIAFAAGLSLATTTLLVRSFLVLVTLTTYIIPKKISITEPKDKIPLCIIRGIGGAMSMLCDYVSPCLLPLSESAFLVNIYPCVTALLSYLLNIEQLKVVTWLGIAGTILGAALVSHPPFLFGGHEEWGIQRIAGLSVASAAVLLKGSAFLLTTKIGPGVPAIVLMEHQAALSFVFTMPFLFSSFPKKLSLPKTVLDAVMIILIGLGSMLNQALIIRALQLGKPTKVTAIMMTSMIHSTIFAIAILGEKMSWVSATGALVVLSSIMLILFSRNSKPVGYTALPQDEKLDEPE